MHKVFALLIAASLSLAEAAVAEQPPAGVLSAIEGIVPGGRPDSVRPAAVPGLYEVTFGPTVFYVSADGRYLVRGDVVDLRTRTNLTRARERDARRAAMARVAEDSMIVFSPAEPRYTISVFTDIDCVYCQRLHRQIEEYMRLGMRIRYLAFPRAGIPSSSYDKAVSVWCAPDPHKAMGDAKAGRPVAGRRCDNPVEEQFTLGRDVGVRGTPTLVLDSGELVPGYVPPQQLLQMLLEGGPG